MQPHALLKLTIEDSRPIWINFDKACGMVKMEDNTRIFFNGGTIDVKETPEQILHMYEELFG